MLYPDLFSDLEKSRWNMASDIPWSTFDGTKLTDEQAITIKMNAITEWSALPATEMFLRDNQHDSDFSAFMSIWFYEEQKHSLVLMEYLKRFRPDMAPTEEELHAVRFPFDPAPALETLMLHFCGEIRLTQWYRRASEWHTEPVIKKIYETMRRAMEKVGSEAKLAYAKIGLLMASAGKAGKPLHPTNLHVNQSMFPNDTVQSKLPDPTWLERWLDTQIQFDKVWEARVINGILKQLSTLFDRTFESTADLNRFRKELIAGMKTPPVAPAAA
jgi:hypothetical protein